MSTLEHDIRYTYITDISYLRRWVNHPSILQWFPMSTEQETEDSLRCWISFSRWSSSLTATINHTPCALGTLFLMPYRKVSHQAIIKMIVDPEFHRKGLGTSLLRNLKHLAKHYFHLELLGTEIFEGNPIRFLLEEQGFREIFRQDHYVQAGNTRWARIYMETDL